MYPNVFLKIQNTNMYKSHFMCLAFRDNQFFKCHHCCYVRLIIGSGKDFFFHFDIMLTIWRFNTLNTKLLLKIIHFGKISIIKICRWKSLNWRFNSPDFFFASISAVYTSGGRTDRERKGIERETERKDKREYRIETENREEGRQTMR